MIVEIAGENRFSAGKSSVVMLVILAESSNKSQVGAGMELREWNFVRFDRNMICMGPGRQLFKP